MKKLLTSLLLFFSLFLTACSLNDVYLEGNNSETEERKEVSQHESENTVPPHMLEFDSYQEIAEFRNILNESEDIVIEYLKEKNHYINGVYSKEDAIKLFDKIKDLEVAYYEEDSEWKLGSITYYVDFELFTIIYGNDNSRVRIRCYINEPDYWKESNGKVTLEESKYTVKAGNYSVKMYENLDERSNTYLTGRFQTSNSYVSLWVESTEESDRQMKTAILEELLKEYKE